MHHHMLCFLSLLLASIVACASFDPEGVSADRFRDRVQTETQGDVTVSAVVLTSKETRGVFDITMQKEKIQPVWLRVENKSEREYIFLAAGMDPAYFSPHETARANHFFMRGGENEKMDAYLYEKHFDIVVAPESINEGVVYTNLDKGMKFVSVSLLGDKELLEFNFILDVPGIKVDFEQIDFDAIYTEEEMETVDEEGLRAALQGLPCCVLGGDKKSLGDPLNLVLIGTLEEMLGTFIYRGWQVTESIHAGSVWQTMLSSVLGSEYRYSPISSLYLFGRGQDIGLQRARGTVDQRNHLRLWLSRYRFEGKPVWVGQISRDIGVKLSSKTFVTHEIDPEVDEARDYVVQDFLLSQRVHAVAFVKGVGEASLEEPRYNFTRSAYFTDGLRAVVYIADDPVPLTEIEFVDWDYPPPGF
jgi:hypothetical protein